MLCILTPLVCLLPLFPWRIFLPVPSPPKSCMLGHLPSLDMWNCFFSCLDSYNFLTNWLDGVSGKVMIIVTRKVMYKPWRSDDPGAAPGFSVANPPYHCAGRRRGAELTTLKGKWSRLWENGLGFDRWEGGSRRAAKYSLSISSCFWLYFQLPGATEKLQSLCKTWRAFHKECAEKKILDFWHFYPILIKVSRFYKGVNKKIVIRFHVSAHHVILHVSEVSHVWAKGLYLYIFIEV